MRLFLALLPFLGVVACSAAPSEISKRSAMVKRAQEVVMFGNHQNRNRDSPYAKKRDSKMSSTVDEKGSVKAHKAVDIPDVETKNLPLQNNIEKELKDVSDDVTLHDDSAGDKEKSDEISGESSEPTTEELLKDFPPETVEALKELEDVDTKNKASSADSENKDITPEQSSDQQDQSTEQQNSEELPENWYEDPYNAFQIYRAYKELLPRYGYFYDYPQRKRRFVNNKRYFLSKGIKRSHRTKRELPWMGNDDVFYNPYFVKSTLPNSYDEMELNREDEKEYEEEQLAAILKYTNLDELREVEHEGMLGVFIPYENQPQEMQPKKRNYFYPFSEEPQTHFGAFVPEKRESRYLDSYERLLQLARALSKDPVSYQDRYKK